MRPVVPMLRTAEQVATLDLGAVIHSVNLDDDGRIVERGAGKLRLTASGWYSDSLATTHDLHALSGWFLVDDLPWRPVDVERPPDPCPGGCGCRWRVDADRAECGCDGPCRGDDLDEPRADGQAWEQRPDYTDAPPELARDAALPVREGFAEHRAGPGLTVGHLLAALRDVPPETVIVLSSDAEGNGHSPLADIAEALYDAESPWSGETYLRDDRIGRDGYTEDDRAPEGAFPVIELGPVN